MNILTEMQKLAYIKSDNKISNMMAVTTALKSERSELLKVHLHLPLDSSHVEGTGRDSWE